jgi:hypothetical protein
VYNRAVPLLSLRIITAAIFGALVLQPAAQPSRDLLAERVSHLTRSTEWTRVGATAVRFKTFHPQGLVKIGDRFFVSSVEVTRPTTRLGVPSDGLDRDAGAGVGHLFQFDLTGTLVADLVIGEGSMYHPGGIDYDGRDIWVTVAEYRPNSRSIVYRIDPKAMRAQEMFRFADHLGAIVHDTEQQSLEAVSWGSRTFYSWRLDADLRVATPAAPLRAVNPSHYVDYQDCKYAARRQMVCSGVSEMRMPDGPAFRLGGIELIDLATHRPLYQVPLLQWMRGVPLTQNPAWLEPTPDGLRGYFMPEDDQSTIYVLEARTGK